MSNRAEKKIETITDLGRKFSDTTILLHEAIAAKAGLSGADHKYLGILMQHGAMTAGQLANLTGLTTGAVTGVIDRLEKKSLVKREFSPDDRRKIMIVVQYEKAMQLLGNVFGVLQKRMMNVMDEFSDDETAVIEKYLIATIKAMNDVTDQLKSG